MACKDKIGREGKMVICERCKGYCDNGEIIGGICLECAEEERQRQSRAEAVSRIMMEDAGFGGKD